MLTESETGMDIEKLSYAERKLLDTIIKYKATNEKVAEILGLKSSTVRVHLWNIGNKMKSPDADRVPGKLEIVLSYYIEKRYREERKLLGIS